MRTWLNIFLVMYILDALRLTTTSPGKKDLVCISKDFNATTCSELLQLESNIAKFLVSRCLEIARN